jgi:hypothetical protein
MKTILYINYFEMAKQVILLGSAYDDPTATPIRNGGDMINDNFTELYDFNSTTNSQSMRRTVVQIGAWDMDTDSAKSVSWTLPSGHVIVNMKALIYPDSNETQQIYPIDYLNSVEGVYIVNGGISFLNNTFYLWRRTGTGYLFDAPEYNSASDNRGYIIVDYIHTSNI